MTAAISGLAFYSYVYVYCVYTDSGCRLVVVIITMTTQGQYNIIKTNNGKNSKWGYIRTCSKGLKDWGKNEKKIWLQNVPNIIYYSKQYIY